MKVISQHELGTVDPKAECFIVKNTLPTADCDAIVATLKQALTDKAPNERFSGNNWYYNVSKQGTHFHSFLLNDIASLQCPPTLKAFETLYRFYQALGDDIRGDFHEHTQTELPADQKTINPLVFWYPTGTGCFDWHQHPPVHQKFQLLINLTQPGIDYHGGHTHVRLTDEETAVFDAAFEKGDMFSFPYDRWHKVEPIECADTTEASLQARISLLMPLHPRAGIPTNYK